MFINLFKQYRHLQRYREIAQILLKNGFGYIVDRLDLVEYLPFKERLHQSKDKVEKDKIAGRFRRVLEELGPTFIKLGQLLSTRPDILSPQYISELRKLQDEVEPLGFEEIEGVIKTELGDTYEEYFREIDPIPLASASISQCHPAVLNDGTGIILKIQKPRIRKKIKVDMEILTNLARLAEDRDLFTRFISPTKIVEEFKESLTKELDFTREVASTEEFRNNFRDNDRIVIPKIYRNLSTRRLIAMEKIEGTKIKNLEGREVNRSLLARVGTRSFMQQIFIDGLFHADPHPGNIYIVEGDRLAFIDFGLMGRLDSKLQNQLSLLFIALLKNNIEIVVNVLIEMGLAEHSINRSKFRDDIQNFINRFYNIELAEINFMAMLEDFQRIIYKYHLRMPDEFYLLIRAIAVSQGVGLMIDPAFNFVEVGNDFVVELLKDRFNPENMAEGLFSKFLNLRHLPGKLLILLNKLIQDEFTINFRHQNLEDLINQLDIVSNRLSVSLIISALIIGSSMILQTDMQPMILNIPLLGLSGYVIAGIFGFWLIIDILKSGRF